MSKRSPLKRRSRSPLKHRSRSPLKRRSRSPLKHRSRSSLKHRSCSLEPRSQFRTNLCQFKIVKAIFRRDNAHPKDCLFNAMEILGIIDSKQAAKYRKDYSSRLMTIDEIEGFFNMYCHTDVFKFKQYTNLNRFETEINKIKPGYTMFVGYTYEKDEGHVFLIGKDKSGLIIIDPQLPKVLRGCTLSTRKCHDLIKTRKIYWILSSTSKRR